MSRTYNTIYAPKSRFPSSKYSCLSNLSSNIKYLPPVTRSLVQIQIILCSYVYTFLSHKQYLSEKGTHIRATIRISTIHEFQFRWTSIPWRDYEESLRPGESHSFLCAIIEWLSGRVILVVVFSFQDMSIYIRMLLSTSFKTSVFVQTPFHSSPGTFPAWQQYNLKCGIYIRIS
jgi:hypothetical protein